MSLEDRNQPPMFLKAKTEEQLRLIMMMNNRKHRRRFHYFDIQFAKGNWYAWFELSLKDELEGSR